MRPTREVIEGELLAWMREDAWVPDDDRFNTLALGLFRFQAEACAPYRALLAYRGVDPSRVEDWRGIPALPCTAFKDLAVCTFPAERAVHRFETSGTTAGRPGTLHLDTLELYEASLRPAFRRGLLPDLAPGDRIAICALAPSWKEHATSSLSHMFGCAIEEWGDAESGFVWSDGAVPDDAFCRWVEGHGAPILLCATAFALVHWLDALDAGERGVRFPEGSRVMETGGFKGRSRSVSRSELYAAIEQRLGVPARRVVNQYGMTELGSQFYDSVLRDEGARRKLSPPWTRVRVVDPATGETVRAGETGVIEIIDLANTGSVLALRTADLGRQVSGDGLGPDGFEVLGRVAGAELRGCSVAVDDALRP